MRRQIACTFTVLFLSVAAANASSPPPLDIKVQKKVAIGFGLMPAGHWAYDAASTLSQVGILDASIASRTTPATRYEFALWTAEILNSQFENYQIEREDLKKAVEKKIQGREIMISDSSGKKIKITSTECMDALDALVTEFSSELRVLALSPSPNYRKKAHTR